MTQILWRKRRIYKMHWTESKNEYRRCAIFPITMTWARRKKWNTIYFCRIRSIRCTGCYANCKPSNREWWVANDCAIYSAHFSSTKMLALTEPNQERDIQSAPSNDAWQSDLRAENHSTSSRQRCSRSIHSTWSVWSAGETNRSRPDWTQKQETKARRNLNLVNRPWSWLMALNKISKKKLNHNFVRKINVRDIREEEE